MARFVKVSLLLTACVLGLAQSAGASIGEPAENLPPGLGIRLIDVPADRADDPRANSYIVDHVLPGGAVERTIRVSNGTDDPIPVQMVAATASIDDGWLVDGANEPGSIATWMSTDPAEFTLAPHSVTDVRAMILVPGGTPPGERYAAFMAEPPPVQTGSVGLVSRVGVRVYLSVGGDEPETDFQIDTLIASRTKEGAPSVDVGILNTGGRAIDVAGELELEDASGSVKAGPFSTTLPKTLAPKSRDQVTVPLPESLAAGPWKVTATMRSGLTERVAEATITFPEPGEDAEPAESETIGGTDEDGNDISAELRGQRRVLLPLAALLILLAIAALWMLILWRRRDKEEDEDDEPEAGASAEAPVGAGDGGG